MLIVNTASVFTELNEDSRRDPASADVAIQVCLLVCATVTFKDGRKERMTKPLVYIANILRLVYGNMAR